MPAPTVAVTIRLSDGDGNAYADTVVTARLDQNDVYTAGEESFVIADPVTGTTDANGEVVLNLFPNHPTDGLGTTGSTWYFSARPSGASGWHYAAQIPNTNCNLADLTNEPAPTNPQSFAASVRTVLLTGLSTATNAVAAASDTVLQAIGKLQAQISGFLTATVVAPSSSSTVVGETGGVVKRFAVSALGPLISVTDPRFGAALDGTTDDTAAFEACAAAVLAATTSTSAATFFAPYGNAYLPNGVNLFGIRSAQILCNIKTDATDDEIVIGSNSTTAAAADIELFTTNGTIKVTGFVRSRLRFNSAGKLWLYASGTPLGQNHTVVYSTFEYVQATTVTLECNQNSGTVSYINENTFICGRTSILNMLGDYNMNMNIFLSMRAENFTATFDKGSCNYFYNTRLEGTCSFTFASGTFNNIFFQGWGNFSYVGFFGRAAATWTITDNGQNNDVVQIQALYTDKRPVFEVSPYHKGRPWAVFESTGALLTIKQNFANFYDSGLVPLDKPVWFIGDADASCFNYIVEAYDASGVQLTVTDPGIMSGGMTWSAVNNHYSYGGAVVADAEIAIAPAAGVAYYRLIVRTAGAMVGQTFTYLRLSVVQKKTGAREIKSSRFGGQDRVRYSGTSAPTYGLFQVGDVVMNSAPAAGGPVGWTCITAGSPGTWAAFGHLVLEGSATYDPGSLADGAGATTTVTVTGAALGDFAEASFSLDLQGITVTAWVSAANTVSVRFQNETTGTLDLASGTLRARVRKA
jgi:hypothetical protein